MEMSSKDLRRVKFRLSQSRKHAHKKGRSARRADRQDDSTPMLNTDSHHGAFSDSDPGDEVAEERVDLQTLLDNDLLGDQSRHRYAAMMETLFPGSKNDTHPLETDTVRAWHSQQFPVQGDRWYRRCKPLPYRVQRLHNECYCVHSGQFKPITNWFIGSTK